MRIIKYYISLLAIIMCTSCTSCASEATSDDYEVWGLDVSRHQSNIDWFKVAEHECPKFVFIKATEGTLIVDPTYDKHRKELNDADIVWGAYHFFGHRTSGKEQARSFIKTAKLKKGNIIPVLDIEMHRFMKDPKRMVTEAEAFCKEIRRYYGVLPIIYCSTHFYTSYLKETFPASRYKLWIADYRGVPPVDWHIWQHTDSYVIKGIRGKVDRNVFSGDLSDFKDYIL